MSESSTRCDFALDALRARVHLHFDSFGRQIITIDTEMCHVTVLVEDALTTLGPVRLYLTGFPMSVLSDQIYRYNSLAHILMAQRLFGPSRRPGRVDALHLRNAIIAIDGERAGASRREIASVIYGPFTDAHCWAEASERLKAMVKRDVLRGRRLMAGGWRDLVVAGSFKRSI